MAARPRPVARFGAMVGAVSLVAVLAGGALPAAAAPPDAGAATAPPAAGPAAPARAATPAAASNAACPPGQVGWDAYSRPAEYGIVTTANVPIEMSDGVTLYADVALPDAPGPFPTIVTQTAYSKDVLGGPADFFVPRGYAQVTVDLRGTGTSEGGWDPFSERERRDGYEVFEWVVDQPWSNGRTAGYGASYLGLTQIFSAAQQPRGLEAIFPIVPVADAYRDIVLMGGQLNVGFMPLWVALVTGISASPNSRWQSDPAGAMQIAADHLLRAGDEDSTAQLLARAFTGDEEIVYDTHFWQDRSPINHVGTVEVPTFITGGLNDLFQRGEPLLYEALKGHVPTKLLMGPWGHVDGSSGAGLAAAGLPAIEDIALRWFDHYLMDLDTKVACIPDVTQWHWGAEEYRTQPDWPHPALAPLPLYLGDGGALTAAAPPAAAGSDVLPPLPFAGVCSRSTSQWLMGVLDRTPCVQDNRLNELLEVQWTSPPFDEDVTINGPIAARLWLESTGPEAVVVVRVTDVAPDGTSKELTNGLQAASFRAVDESRSRIVDGWNLQPWHPYTKDSVAPMPSGEAVPVDVEVFSTAAVVKAGHAIRVSVGAADFPHAVSPLPSLPAATTAVTTVHHGPDTPSYVVLPVVGASRPGPPAGTPGPPAAPAPPAAPSPPTDAAAAADGGAPLPTTGGPPGRWGLLPLLLARGVRAGRGGLGGAQFCHADRPAGPAGLGRRAVPPRSQASTDSARPDPARREEQRERPAVLLDLVDVGERDVGEPGDLELGLQRPAVEAVVTVEAGVLAVERAVLGLEVHHREVAAVAEQFREPGEHRLEMMDVVQRHHGRDEVEPFVGDRGGGEVEVPDARAAGQRPEIDLGGGDLAHPGGRLGERDRPDVVGERLGDEPGARPVLEQPGVRGQRDRAADRFGHHPGAFDLRRVVVPGRGFLVEVGRHVVVPVVGRGGCAQGALSRARPAHPAPHAPPRTGRTALAPAALPGHARTATGTRPATTRDAPRHVRAESPIPPCSSRSASVLNRSPASSTANSPTTRCTTASNCSGSTTPSTAPGCSRSCRAGRTAPSTSTSSRA
jgi:uncharacterized protein